MDNSLARSDWQIVNVFSRQLERKEININPEDQNHKLTGWSAAGKYHRNVCPAVFRLFLSGELVDFAPFATGA